MLTDSPSPRLLQLLARVSDGSLDQTEAAELNEILRSDASARTYYRSHVAVHMALRKIGQADRKVVGFPPVRRARRWPVFATAAVVALAAGATWWMMGNGREDTRQPPTAQAFDERPFFAVASAADEVRWSLPETPEGGRRLGGGIVRLFTGNLSLLLAGGQMVHLKGPAEFELLPDGEFALRKGPAAFRTIGGKAPFIVHLPKGALVDMGSDYSVQVEPDGSAEVRVFESKLVASSVGALGSTVEELLLEAGRSILVGTRLSPGTLPESAFLRVPPTPLAMSPGGEEAYASAIRASLPLAYWRFESLDAQRQVADEVGKYPLELHERARLSGRERQRFLVLDNSDAKGFAGAVNPIPALDIARGVTVECLVFPSSENYGTAVGLPVADLALRPPDTPASLVHAPHTFALDRMGRKGEHLGHIHPDFSLRAVFRTPAGYNGGTNVYSRESHLLHRWIHVAAVRDGNQSLLYVDGKLSDAAESSLIPNHALLLPIIGRLHPQDQDRQWIGGIDEVAIYDHALTAEEIASHFTALKR